jgi:type II secretory ATPase GspE/PulE/Tfp pilus assembly ATPase PilB-like protein
MENSILEELKGSVARGDVSRFIAMMFEFAVSKQASDIHIEPLSTVVIVRLRMDGILQKILEYPLTMHSGVVSKLKIMSNLKIDEQRIPQDGRINVRVKSGELDLRISSYPTINGEKIVIRILDKNKKLPALEELGIEGSNQDILLKALNNPVGILLTTGPTGSGKTTTLYTCLQRLNKEGVNIVTIEDPIEMKIDGLNQSQVQPQIGYTFASGFRSILRQDPDIIMVGEIRDQETMDVAIEAALTGHLVLSTLHTNSAAQTITRMIDMGEKSFLIGATVNAIIAQRLVRKICPYCKKSYTPTVEMFEEIKKTLSDVSKKELYARLPEDMITHVQLYKGEGCEKCEGTGYKGRIGLYEILVLDKDTKRMVLENKPADDIEKVAIRNGMISLKADGIIKAIGGKTTIEEVYRVVKGK